MAAKVSTSEIFFELRIQQYAVLYSFTVPAGGETNSITDPRGSVTKAKVDKVRADDLKSIFKEYGWSPLLTWY